VGIGTASPAVKLDVVGKISSTLAADNNLTVKSTGGSSSAYIQIDTSRTLYDYGGYLYHGQGVPLWCTGAVGNGQLNQRWSLDRYNGSSWVQMLNVDTSGNLSVTGTINKISPAATNTQFFGVSGGTTAYTYGQITNTGGSLNWGIDTSTGGGLMTGTSAYSSSIYTGTATPLHFGTNNILRATLDASGNLGIGTASPSDTIGYGRALDIQSNTGAAVYLRDSDNPTTQYGFVSFDGNAGVNNFNIANSSSAGPIRLITNGSERMRIDSSGNLLVGKSVVNDAAGTLISASGIVYVVRNADVPLAVNRLSNDGQLVALYQDTILEGNISVSGTTVSYNGGHLARWSQLLDSSKNNTILKGTVMSNLDDMCVWEKDGVVAENEQLNKMKVSDVEGDTNVAGVFVNWTIDDAYGVDDMNVAMTGDMIIRIADGVVVQKGDLLMSAGDGTAKPQNDDIVRSKTIAKVTSNYITCTYEDGSYCVPCVLMAC
jgi:hypothetical protein